MLTFHLSDRLRGSIKNYDTSSEKRTTKNNPGMWEVTRPTTNDFVTPTDYLDSNASVLTVLDLLGHGPVDAVCWFQIVTRTTVQALPL